MELGDDPKVLAVLRPGCGGGAGVPVRGYGRDFGVEAIDGRNVELEAVGFVRDAVLLLVCELLTVGRPARSLRTTLGGFRRGATGAVDCGGGFGAVVRDDVDVGCGVVGLGELGSLSQESDGAAVGGKVVVARVAEGLNGGLWEGDGGVDTGEEVLEFTVQLEVVAVAGGEHTREDGKSLGRDVSVPVADEASIVDVTAALGQFRGLLVVSRAIAVRLRVHEELDVSRLGLHGLESREGRVERRDELPTSC